MSVQLELFSRAKDAGEIKNRSSDISFLEHIWHYEKTILIIIGMVITSIISFSLGVEKGKRVSLLRTNFQPTIENKTRDAVIPKEQLERIPVKKEEGIKGPAPLEKQNYVIQLASYKTKLHAQKEVELLKKRGLSPSLLPKGSYIVLYVGNFSNKQNAQSVLAELKKRYRDCYIRRL